MWTQDNYALAKFGIDEIYIHENLTYCLLEKLYRQSVFSLDGDDTIVQKYVAHDMVLIFHHKVPSKSFISQFLKFLDQDANKESFITSHTLLNEEELFSAIKSKKFILITNRILLKETYTPT